LEDVLMIFTAMLIVSKIGLGVSKDVK
jgi:hypothetical protein